MACPSDKYPGPTSSGAPWHNWARLVGGRVESFHEPASLGDVVRVVMNAEAAGQRVRAVGSGWAYEDLAYSPEVMVSLARLNKVLDYVTDPGTGALLSPVVSGGRTLVHVEGGMKVATLNAQLAMRGLAMPTLGGSNGQSIVGALSTSTHGGDFAEPPFCDLIHAVHLVGPGGQEYWFERASAPVTSSARLGLVLPCPDTLVVRDDEAFDAIAVGLGRFGVVYSVILETVPAYALATEPVLWPWPKVRDSLRQGIDEGTFLGPLLDSLPPPSLGLGNTRTGARGMQLVIDSRNSTAVYVLRTWPATEPDPNFATSSNALCDLGADTVLTIGAAGLNVLAFEPTSVKNPLDLFDPTRPVRVTEKQLELLASIGRSLTPGEALAMVTNAYWELDLNRVPDTLSQILFQLRWSPQRGPSYAVMTGAPTYDADGAPLPHELHGCYTSNSCEIVFDAADPRYLDLLDNLTVTAPRFDQSGYLSLRFCARSRALLSMHNVESGHAASIEVASVGGLRGNANWMEYILQEAQARGGRPHWGQQNHTTATQIEGLYGSRLDRWRAVLGGLSGDSTLFSNAFTKARGLEPRGRRDLQIEGVASHLTRAVDAAVTLLLLE